MRVILFATLALTAAVQVNAQPPAQKATELVLEDQFDRKADLADLRGQVVILVYGDRKATDLCKTVGESLHVCWHPEAKGQPPAKAQAAPVVPLENLKPGQVSPNVVVVPVACCGKVPGPIQKPIRSQIAKASPDAVVWLDFGNTMKTMFGQTAGEPNLAVFDAAGQLRFRFNGTPDQVTMEQLAKTVQELRVEAVR
jgi:hypothetical protein